MPDESLWATFFTPVEVLRSLSLNAMTEVAVDFGCGYGTFTVAAAQKIRGLVLAFDIDPQMVSRTQNYAVEVGLTNVIASQCDFVVDGTGLPADSADYAMLFNILHAEHPEGLTREAYRILQPGGALAVMHWRCDPNTPRGPSLDIRPRPEQCMEWCRNVGFDVASTIVIDLPPYHYGFLAVKKERNP